MSKRYKKARRHRTRDFDDPRYIEWRKAVFKRDKHTCQWPGCTKKRGLNAHHIRKWAEYPTLRFVVANGISLCYLHHKGIQQREDDYIIEFYRILSNQLKHV